MLTKSVTRFAQECRGSVCVEYALIASIIAVAIATGVVTLGNSVENTYETLDSEVSGAM